MEDVIFAYRSIEDIIEQGHELEVVNGCEFEIIINENGTLSLIDWQGANLGNIEGEVFKTYKEILYRLEGSYLYDYGFVDIK